MSDLRTRIRELIDEHQWQQLRNEAWEDWLVPDIVDALLGLNKNNRVLAFRLIPREMSAEVFAYLEKEDRNALLKDLTDEETRHLLADLAPDDRTTLFEELPGQVTQRLLNLLSPEDLREARFLLGYPEYSVGRLMTPDYVAVRPEWTVAQALEHCRVKAKKSETLHVIYVVDASWRLLDALELYRFILAKPEEKVEEIMNYSFVSLSAFDDREEAVYTMQKYDLFSLPVVDSSGVLVGLVTFDDVFDVAQEEATEDIYKGAAVTPLTTSYREASVWELYSKRVSWLVILVFVSLLSAGVVALFEGTLQKVIALTIFIPLLLGSGGNAGAQSATLMVRALATGDLELSQWFSTLLKEMVVGVSLGLTLGVFGTVFGFMRGGWEIGLIVGLTTVGIILLASLIGVTLPFILTRLNLDPAVASSPLITSITDFLGLLLYFVIAGVVLGFL
ncbi:MAG: magnesium transporter [Syntrophomonadales bacterium]|jgi:magnesium transporter